MCVCVYICVYIYICKRDIKFAQISIESWEFAAADQNNWRQAVQSGMRKAEELNCGRRRERTSIVYKHSFSQNQNDKLMEQIICH